MAEVAIAIADAVRAMFDATIVITLVVLVKMIMDDYDPAIPFVGGLFVGSIVGRLVAAMDPFAALGLGGGTAALVFSMLQPMWGKEFKDGNVDQDTQAEGLQSIAMVVLGGFAFGLTHLITKSLVVSLLAGAGGFLFGRTVGWNAFVNAYYGLGLFTGPAGVTPISTCNYDYGGAKKEQYMKSCMSNDPVKNLWCELSAQYQFNCPNTTKPPNPGPFWEPPGDKYTLPAPGSTCKGYPTAEIADPNSNPQAPPTWNQICECYDDGGGLGYTNVSETEVVPGTNSDEPWLCKFNYWSYGWSRYITLWDMPPCSGSNVSPGPPMIATNYAPNPAAYTNDPKAGTFCVPYVVDANTNQAIAAPANPLNWQPLNGDRKSFCADEDWRASNGWSRAMVNVYPGNIGKDFSCQLDPAGLRVVKNDTTWPT